MGAAYKITPELRAEMQADRDAGMSVAQVATKYGVSYVSVEKHTIHRKGGYAAPVSAAKNPITQEELSVFQAGLRVGMRMDLMVMQYDEAGIQTGFKKERCRIEHGSRHVVVFRRPNGRMEHRTVVELCQMGRGGA